MYSVFNNTTLSTNGTTMYTPPPIACRDRLGDLSPDLYNIITCALCYIYVYSNYNVSLDYGTLELVTGTNTAYPEGTRMYVNPDDRKSTEFVCGSLFDHTDCTSWKECCSEAQKCCRDQISRGSSLDQDYGRTMCPMTWDGFACWPETPAGHTPKTKCPSHLTNDHGLYAYKICTENATWYEHPLTNKEWTDYTECSNMEHQQRIHLIGMVCTITTMFILIPACIIFLYYRQLRQQLRIRLHICLMTSSFITSASLLIWEIYISKNSLDTETRANINLRQNSIGCRFLSALTRYSEISSFMWMFIEGFHLHRLLVHAFTVPKTLIPYCIFGFGFPLIPVGIFSIIRTTHKDLNRLCWMPNAGSYEWIVIVPSAIALVINIIFLFRIVFIMLRQLQRHPDEPSNFRRAVKAVVMLVPLFGAQLLLFAYVPAEDSVFKNSLELTSKIFSSLQGTFIAIAVCFLNTEVQGYLKTSCKRLHRYKTGKDSSSRSFTLTTQFASEINCTRSTNDNGNSCQPIALRPINRQNSADDDNIKDISCGLINGDLHGIPENIDENVPLNYESECS